MSGPPLLRPRERNVAIWIFLILLFMATAANVPFAVSRIHSRHAPDAPRVLLLHGEEAGEYSWPASTPHEAPWPAPTYYDLEREFGFSHYHVQRREGQGPNGFSMQLVRMGWPFGVLEKKQMWWDWGDKLLDGPEPDPRMYVKPLGLILNPIIAAGIPYVVLVGPVGIFVVAQRARRRRRGRCIYCSYPLEQMTTCPECGVAYA